MRYLIDTSIWMDILEDRKGYKNEPLGSYALKLIKKILTERNRIIKTELLIKELKSNYSMEQITGMLTPFDKILDFIQITAKQNSESDKLVQERKVPKGDALHAIIARDHNLILITRDKHFKLLKDLSRYYKPEELI